MATRRRKSAVRKTRKGRSRVKETTVRKLRAAARGRRRDSMGRFK